MPRPTGDTSKAPVKTAITQGCLCRSDRRQLELVDCAAPRNGPYLAKMRSRSAPSTWCKASVELLELTSPLTVARPSASMRLSESSPSCGHHNTRSFWRRSYRGVSTPNTQVLKEKGGGGFRHTRDPDDPRLLKT
jgi:hypothetical protein